MKRKLVILVSGLVLGGTLAFTLPSVFASNSTPAPAPMMLERHPQIHKAIAAIEDARIALKNADHDFGGHRAAALEECDKALVQLRACLEYDR